MAAMSSPAGLFQLRAAASTCRECPLGALARQTVWGEGPPTATLMFVGEQPCDREDLLGRPFVGRGGRVLDSALAQLGLPRERVYLTNAVKHFKYQQRGKRRMHKTPAVHEAVACSHWLESEISALAPRAIVALGPVAARSLLGWPVPVQSERGRWHRRDDGIPVLVTVHPTALLRGGPAQFDQAFASWLADLEQATRIPAPAAMLAPPASTGAARLPGRRDTAPAR